MKPAWLEVLADAVSWVATAYPEEGCGLVVHGADGYRFLACENLANEYHAVDPQTYPRTAREFYIVDPLEFIRAEDRGERVAVVVHSHADVGDYFSDEDVAGAVMPQFDENETLEPAHPGVDYLVISVRQKGPDHASLFRFDAAADHGFEKVWARAL